MSTSARIRDLAQELAAELERQHLKQNETFTTAIVDASLTWEEHLAALRADVAQLHATVEAHMKLSTAERAELERRVNDQLESLRAELRSRAVGEADDAQRP